MRRRNRVFSEKWSTEKHSVRYNCDFAVKVDIRYLNLVMVFVMIYVFSSCFLTCLFDLFARTIWAEVFRDRTEHYNFFLVGGKSIKEVPDQFLETLIKLWILYFQIIMCCIFVWSNYVIQCELIKDANEFQLLFTHFQKYSFEF